MDLRWDRSSPAMPCRDARATGNPATAICHAGGVTELEITRIILFSRRPRLLRPDRGDHIGVLGSDASGLACRDGPTHCVCQLAAFITAPTFPGFAHFFGISVGSFRSPDRSALRRISDLIR